MKISHYIAAQTLITGIGGALLVLCLSLTFLKLESEQHQLGMDSLVLKDIQRLKENFRQWLTAMDLILGSGETYLIAGVQTQTRTVTAIIQAVCTSPISADDTRCLSSTKQLLKYYDTLLQALASSPIAPTEQYRAELLKEFDDRSTEALQALQMTEQQLIRQARFNSSTFTRLRFHLLLFSASAVGCYLILVLLLWRWLFLNLAKPLQNLTRASDTALKQDTKLQFLPSGSTEIKQLANSVQTFIHLLENKVIQRTQALQAQKETLEYEIEERKIAESRAESALLAAQKATRIKSQFLANMSHEIRTPLNGVIGMLQLLQGQLLDAKGKRYLKTALYSGELLLALINDILDFSKMEAGKIQLESKPLNLKIMFEECSELFSEQATNRNLWFRYSIAPTLDRDVLGDPTRIQQVVNNLLSNALKFTQQGTVSMALQDCTETPDCVHFRCTVTDTGIGISDAVQAELFTAFRQADGSTTREFGGTGLGLAISKQIIQAMDGRMGVNSQPGHGSTFWFELTLPVQQALKPVVSDP